jgi:hypothetical protein
MNAQPQGRQFSFRLDLVYKLGSTPGSEAAANQSARDSRRSFSAGVAAKDSQTARVLRRPPVPPARRSAPRSGTPCRSAHPPAREMTCTFPDKDVRRRRCCGRIATVARAWWSSAEGKRQAAPPSPATERNASDWASDSRKGSGSRLVVQRVADHAQERPVIVGRVKDAISIIGAVEDMKDHSSRRHAGSARHRGTEYLRLTESQ